jgi:O-antigen/teichoic acid export membrane protein
MRDAVTTFAIRIVGAGAALGLQLLLSRLMSVSAFGQYALLWTWLIALGAFVSLGYTESAVRFLPRYAARNRHADAAAFRHFAWQQVLTFTGGTGALGLVLVWFLPLPEGWRVFLLCLCLGLPLLGIEYLSEGIARSLGHFYWPTALVYIVRPLFIAIACVGLYLNGIALSFDIAAAVLLAIMVVTATALALKTQQWGTKATPSPITPARAGMWRRASLPLALHAGLDDFLSYVDVLLVGALVGPAEAAIYFAATRILVVSNYASYALFFVAGRKFSLAHTEQGRAGTLATFKTLTGWSIAASIAVAIPIAVLGSYLLSLFGSAYTAGYPVLVLLAVATVMRSLSGQAQELLMVTGQQRRLLNIAAFVLVIGAAMIIAALMIWGAFGAAAAMIVVQALRSALLLRAVYAPHDPQRQREARAIAAASTKTSHSDSAKVRIT